MKKSDREYINFMSELHKAQRDGDIETAHSTADAVLCDIALNTNLNSKQRKALVAEYDKVEKYYS